MLQNALFLSLFAGVCWGLWPMVMSRSGLNLTISSMVFAGIAFVLVSAFGLMAGAISIPQAKQLNVGIVAGVLGGIGLLAFNHMLAISGGQAQAARGFLAMLIVQTSVPAMFVLADGGLTAKKAGGVAAAILAIFLLA